MVSDNLLLLLAFTMSGKSTPPIMIQNPAMQIEEAINTNLSKGVFIININEIIPDNMTIAPT